MVEWYRASGPIRLNARVAERVRRDRFEGIHRRDRAEQLGLRPLEDDDHDQEGEENRWGAPVGHALEARDDRSEDERDDDPKQHDQREVPERRKEPGHRLERGDECDDRAGTDEDVRRPPTLDRLAFAHPQILRSTIIER